MGIRKTRVALCNFFVGAPQKVQDRQAGIFHILSLLPFFPQKLQETHISALSVTLYLSGRSNWNFGTEHFTKSLPTN